LTHPLIRRDRQLVSATWDEALDYIAEKLIRIKSQHGADSIGGIGSLRCTNEENYLFQKFMRVVVGTNNVDSGARLGHAAAIRGMEDVLGIHAATGPMEDLTRAKVILIVGTDANITNPVFAIQAKIGADKNGAKIIVADSTPTSILPHFISTELQYRPGTEEHFLKGLLHIILKEGLENQEFVKERRVPAAEIRKAVSAFTPEVVSQATGIAVEELAETARTYALSGASVIIFGKGTTQSSSGYASVVTMAYLALVTGNLDREGAGLFPMTDRSNEMGACDAGVLPNYLPGYQPVSDGSARGRFEKGWGGALSERPGRTVMEMLRQAQDGGVKALYVMGENVAFHYPDMEATRKALENLDLLVVQDIFFNETAFLADVVLPASSHAEKEGTVTNLERRVQRLRKILRKIGDSLPDAEIVAMLSRKMGYPMLYGSYEEIFEEMASLSPIHEGIRYSALGEEGIFWPRGEKRLMTVKSGGGETLAVLSQMTAIKDGKGEDYPFLLKVKRVLYHSGTLSRMSDALNTVCPEPLCEMSVEDGRERGIEEGDRVRITNGNGEGLEVKATLVPHLPRKIVTVPNHFESVPVNLLLKAVCDPVTGVPVTDGVFVNVEKIGVAARV
jgi:formate dehydrogenase alpha subunit